jgi:aspartate racemase
MIKIIKKLEKVGARGIILVCTELPLLISDQDANIPIINTTEILEDSSINNLINKIK